MIKIQTKSSDIIPIPFTKKLTQYEKDFLKELLQSINQQIDTTTEFLNSQQGKEYFQKIQKLKQEFFNDELLKQELDYIIHHSTDNIQQFINDFYETGAKIGYNDIKRRLNYTPADEQTLYHLTQYNFDLIRNLNTELSYGIRRTIFEGAMKGKNPLELVPIIEELPLKPLQIPLPNGKYRLISTRTRAEMIARTEYARAQCTGKLQAYANYGIEKVDILTCGDKLVCDICTYYENHSPWELRQAAMLLPAHPNCRCTYMAHILDDSVIPSEPVSDPELMNLTHNLNITNPEKSITLDGVTYKNMGGTPEDKLNFLETYGIKKEELTEEELTFLKVYTDGGDEYINWFLRNSSDYTLKYCREEWNKLMENFDGKYISFDRALNIRHHVFNKGKIITEDILLVRREQKDDMMNFSDNNNVYHAQGELSSAISHDIKPEKYGGHRNFLLIPKGTKILYLEGVTNAEEDFEVLFPDGTRFQHIDSGLGENDRLWKLIN